LQLLSPLRRLSLGSASVSEFLALLEWGTGGLVWLQNNWGICTASCRPPVLRAQTMLQQLVDTAAQTFTRRFSRQFNPCLDPLHISATAQRVRDHLLKQLDHDLRTTQYQLILDCVVQLSLPRLQQGLGQQDLSCYEQIVYSDFAPFLQPHVLYHRVLTDCLTTEIRQVVMNHTLPKHCIPLPVAVLPEHVYEDWPPGGDLQPCSWLSESSTLSSSADSYENIQD
ncbi:protein Niban-like isoform X2, partial [Arapaima gigas]